MNTTIHNTRFGSPYSTPWFTALLLTALMASPVTARASSAGGSSGSGFSSELSLGAVALSGATITSLAQSSGEAPPAYSTSQSGVPLNASVGTLGIDVLRVSGTALSSAVSDLNGAPGTHTTSASGGVQGLSLALADAPDLPLLPATPPLISISATAVSAQGQVSGVPGSQTASGSSTLTNLVLRISGVQVQIPANPAPNTVIGLSLAGATLYLNEQAVVTGSAGSEIAVTALRLKLDGVQAVGLGLLSGEFKIGSARALQGTDRDGDAVLDLRDSDSDGDGMPDADEIARARNGGDSEGDGVPDHLDLDSDDDGINDVLEAGGSDADGNGRQDGQADANRNGLADAVDPVAGGTPLPVPDSDGDMTRNYLDLDCDNDTVGDLLESGSGAPDLDRNGMADGTDTDGDGIRSSVDGLPSPGDANDPQPRNFDRDDLSDCLDPDSDRNGIPDIVTAGSGLLDTDGNGQIDGPYTDPDSDGIDVRVDSLPGAFGGTSCLVPGADWRRARFTSGELENTAISGWDADPDKDGMSNALEYLLGTDPKTASPYRSLDSQLLSGGGGLNISFIREPCTYANIIVETSTDLLAWADTGVTYLSDSSGLLQAVIYPGSGGLEPRMFARLKIIVP